MNLKVITTNLSNQNTYFRGKRYQHAVDLIEIAEQLGEEDMVRYLVETLRKDLARFLTDKGQSDPMFFYYNDEWGVLTGYQSAYGSEEQINDHHFHYDYFIKAAATIAKYDPCMGIRKFIRRYDQYADQRRCIY